MSPFLFPSLIFLAALIACLLSWWLGKIGRGEELAALVAERDSLISSVKKISAELEALRNPQPPGKRYRIKGRFARRSNI